MISETRKASPWYKSVDYAGLRPRGRSSLDRTHHSRPHSDNPRLSGTGVQLPSSTQLICEVCLVDSSYQVGRIAEKWFRIRQFGLQLRVVVKYRCSWSGLETRGNSSL